MLAAVAIGATHYLPLDQHRLLLPGRDLLRCLWRMIADNGHDTGVTIADLRAEGFGFVVNWEWQG